MCQQLLATRRTRGILGDVWRGLQMSTELEDRVDAIAKLMHDLGWDQRTLAREAGIHFTTFNKILSGKRIANSRQVEMLERAVVVRMRKCERYLTRHFGDSNWEDVTRLDGLSVDALIERAEVMPWRQDVLYAARDISRDLAVLTNGIGSAAIEAFRSHRNRAAGLLANLLTISSKSWEKPTRQFNEMERLVRRQIRHGDVGEFYPVQILASVVGRTDGEETGRSYLRMSINEAAIRAEEWQNTNRYYGTTAARYHAYVEHRERPAGRAIRYWDLPSLVEDLWRAPPTFAVQETAPLIVALLREFQSIDFHLSRDWARIVDRRCSELINEHGTNAS